MTYKEILSQLGYQIEELKHKKNFKDIITPSYIKTFESFYNDSMSLIKTLDNIKISQNKEEVNSLSKLDKTIDLLNERSKKDIEYYNTIKNQKNNIIHEDISFEAKNYNFKKDENRRKIVLESESTKEKLNSTATNITIDNNNLDTFRYPSKETYNFYIERFSKQNQSEYQQFHAHISKTNYSLKNAFDEISEHFKEQIDDIDKHIKHLETSSNDKKIDLTGDIIKDETLLNQKIKELSEKYLKLKNQNEVQTSVELTDIRHDISSIENKYQQDIKSINKQASVTLKKTDKEHETLMQSLEQEIMDKTYHHTILVKANKEKYNLLVNDFKQDQPRLTYLEKKVRKNELKHLLKDNKMTELDSKKEIDLLNEKKNKLQAKNILDRTLIDLRRKYEISCKNLNENLEKYPLLKKLSQIDLEKKSYDKILDNMLSIVINKEKLVTELIRINKENNYNIFNTRQLIEITSSKLKKEEIILDSKLSDDIEKIILSSNDEKDKLTLNNSNNTSLLSIEKNKHLHNMNNDSIEHVKKLNLLYLEHFNKLKNIDLNHKIELAKEDNQYNDTAIDIYKEIKSNDSDNISSEYKHSLVDYEASYNYNLSNEHYKIQLTAKNHIVNLIKNELETFTTLVTNYKNTVVPHVYSIINYVKAQPKKIDIYDPYISKMYHTFFNLIDNFLIRVKKAINTYIKYNTGNKYDNLEENTNYSYNQKIISIDKDIELYKMTIKNYQNGISSFYNSINELNLMIHQEQLKFNTQQDKKNIKKNILSCYNQINHFRVKITENDKKIEEINLEINNLIKKKNKLEKSRDNEILRLNNLERHDSMASTNFLENIQSATDEYKKFLTYDVTFEVLHKLENNIFKTAKFYSIVRNFEYKFIKMRQQIQKSGQIFDLGTNKTILQIKADNDTNYQKTKEIADKQKESDNKKYIKDNNKLEQKFILANLTHHQKINQINSIYKIKTEIENKDYNMSKDSLINEFNSKVTNYYNLFESCDYLIKNSKVEYAQSISNIDYKQRKNVKKLTNIAANQKKILQKENNQQISKYRDEIILLPHYKQDLINQTISSFKELNNSLTKGNDSIKEEINNNKKAIKKDIDIYSKEIRLELKNEYNNYKKNQHRIREEYLENIKNK